MECIRVRHDDVHVSLRLKMRSYCATYFTPHMIVVAAEVALASDLRRKSLVNYTKC